ncbi:hypothetical protein ACOSP7_023695 [Xanthoceras sorbifolium]
MESAIDMPRPSKFLRLFTLSLYPLLSNNLHLSQRLGGYLHFVVYRRRETCHRAGIFFANLGVVERGGSWCFHHELSFTLKC